MWILFLGIFTVCLVVLNIPIILSSCFTTPAFPEYLCTLLNITRIQSFTCYPKTETGSVTEKITWYVLVLNSPEVLSLDKEVLNNKIDLWLVWQC